MSEYNDKNDNDNNNVELFGGDELIYRVETGGNGEPNVTAGGYQVGSYFLQQEMSPIRTLNSENQESGKEKVSSPFEYLAVPAGLFYINVQDNKSEKDITYQKHNTVDDDLYEKLFSLIQEEPKKHKNKKTRRHNTVVVENSKSKKKTRKNV